MLDLDQNRVADVGEMLVVFELGGLLEDRRDWHEGVLQDHDGQVVGMRLNGGVASRGESGHGIAPVNSLYRIRKPRETEAS